MRTGFASGNQNITINSTATSTTGTWTVTGSSAPYNYTFQPNAATDVSNLNVSDIVACFTGSNRTLGGGGTPPNTNGKVGNVTILTASTGSGVGTGNVIISQPISTLLSSPNQLTLTITASGSITISNTISLKGNTGGTTSIAPGFPGANVILNSGTGVTMNSGSGIQTDGGAGSTVGGAGGNAGAITLVATTGNAGISISSTATGGAGGLGGGAGGVGGNLTLTAPAGTISISNGVNTNGGTGSSNGIGGNAGAWNISALSTVTISVACSSNGGNGGSVSGNGGAGGAMSFISSASNVVMGNSLSSIGGRGIEGNSSGGNGGNVIIYSATNFNSSGGNDINTSGGNAKGTGSSGSGGNVTITGNAANGGLSLARTYTTIPGTGGTGTAGTAGTLTVSTGNSVVTSGVNDGQSASPTIATGSAPFTKIGAGTFLLGSANNNYTGLTTVSTGTLKIATNNALGNSVASGTTVSNGATIDINNVNYSTVEALSLTGTGISNLGAMTTSNGVAGRWSGVVTIAGGTSIGAATSSTLRITGQVTGSGGLTKVDYGVLALESTANNYSGNTTITTGTLQINAAGVIPGASAVVLNGGTLRTNGAFSETMGTLTVNAGSFITFGSTGAHTLTFANSNAITWGTTAAITITGWTGTYGTSTTGTTKLIVGSTGNVLTAAQLAKIQFVDATGVYWSAQTLSTGEVVPGATGNMFYAIANGNWDVNTTWSNTPNGSPVASGVFPISTKNVVISGYTVTLTAAAACNNITFGNTANGLTMGANNLTVFGNVNIVTACPVISTSGGAIIFDGTNNSSQTITSSCSPSLGNVTLANGANVSTNSGVTFSVVNFTSSTGTTSWTNNGATALTVTGVLAAPSCLFISNNSAVSYNFSVATNNPLTVGGLTSNSGGTINLGSKNTTISSLLSHTSGTVTSTGMITMAANAVITVKNSLTIANLQLGGSAVTSTGGGTLTATIFDFNGQTSFIQTAGVITTSTINNNTGPISMCYSGNPTFIYSGTGVIPSGSYYNLTTTTGTKSLTCSSTITVDGVLTNSSGTITGPATSGQFGRIVHANPVNNIGGTIGSATTNLSFSGSIQGGTIIGSGTNVLQNSVQSPSCTFYTLSTTTLSGYMYCQGLGPSSSQSFTVSGSGLTGSGNVVVTGSADYEVSSNNTTFGASASFAFAGGSITGQPRTVYVRLKAGLTAASYNSENITVASAGGASAKTVSNSGTVSASVTPSVTASSTATTICAGNSITLTAAPTNGGTTPTYQWSKGGSPISGATNAIYTTSTTADNDSYTTAMTSNAMCASPETVTSTAVVITVNAIPTVTSTIPSTRCGTGTLTLGATSSIGSLDWYSAASGGTSLGTGTSFVTPGISTTTMYYVAATNLGCSSARTAVTATIDNTCAYTWIGTTSNNWNDGSNWSTGNVPSTLNDVVIPSGTLNAPIITTTGNVRSLRIDPSTTLTVSGGTLSIYNDLTINGTFTHTAGIVSFRGNSTQTVTSATPFILKDVTLNGAGVSFTSQVSLEGIVILTQGTLTTNDKVTLKPDNGGMVAFVDGNRGTVSGQVTVVKAIASNWRYISSPLEDVQASELSDDMALVNGSLSRLSTFDYSIPGFKSRTDLGAVQLGSGGAAKLFVPAAGGGITADFTGTINNTGSVTSSVISNTSTNRDLFVGNPYPSSLNIDATADWTFTGVTPTFYFWNSSSNSFSTYQRGAPGVGANGGTNIIPMFQAFFLKTTGAGGNASVTMGPRIRVTTTRSLYRTSLSDENLSFKVTSYATSATDETIVRLSDGGSIEFDAFDSYKFRNPSTFINLFTKSDNIEYVINTVPLSAETVVPLNLIVPANGTYSITVPTSATSEVVLKDKLLNIEKVADGTDYVFTATTADNEARFEILFRISITTGTRSSTAASNVNIASTGKNIVVIAKNSLSNSTLRVYNTVGALVLEVPNTSIAAGTNVLEDISLESGAYIITISNDGNEYIGHTNIIK